MVRGANDNPVPGEACATDACPPLPYPSITAEEPGLLQPMVEALAQMAVRRVSATTISSDLLNPRSAEDQFAALRLVAQARGWQEVAAFSDLGISGASINNQPGVQTLLREAEGGAFDVVVTEALDRLSRDPEGTPHLFRRLSYYVGSLKTLSEGKISELHVGLSAR